MKPVRVRFAVCCLLAALLASTAVRSERVEDVSNPRARDGSWVTDHPGALKPDTISELNTAIALLEQDTTAEIAVVVIQSLEGMSVDEFANRLFNLWGIGKRETDNGLLLLWSVGDRQVRIEVGIGLQSRISDSRAGSILDNFVIPYFRAGEFDQGLLTAIQILAAEVRGNPSELEVETSRFYAHPEDPNSGESAEWTGWVGGGLGSLATFLGGLFGIRRWRRYRKRHCPSCNQQMERLGEKEDDRYLDEVKKLEERLESVDYDVWRCPGCGHHFILRYPRWFSAHGTCPQCSNRTNKKTETTVRAATTSSTGSARVVEDCQFCSYHRQYYRTIPRRSSSSSSSSGSSSFGGGRSSGGGASRGY